MPEAKIGGTPIKTYYQEYLEYKSSYWNELPNTFLQFCFLRKNIAGRLTTGLDFNRFYNYVLKFEDSFWYDLEDKKSAIGKQYEEFKAKFFGDNFVISLGDDSNAI